MNEIIFMVHEPPEGGYAAKRCSGCRASAARSTGSFSRGDGRQCEPGRLKLLSRRRGFEVRQTATRVPNGW